MYFTVASSCKTGTGFLKVDLLCKGLRCSEKAFNEFRKQNPFSERASGLGMGGYLKLPSGEFVNANVYYKSGNNSPYFMEEEGEGFCLRKGEERIGKTKILKAPDWYFERTSSGLEMGRLCVQHGKNQLTSPVYADCQLFTSGEECKFCAIGLNVPELGALKIKKPGDIVEAVARALQSNPNYQLELQGGTTYTSGAGFEIYLSVARAVRNISSIPIAIEAAPPLDDRYICEAADTGINALLINLELFDENQRMRFCPGKARIFTRDRYFEVFALAIKLLGTGNVGSCLIFGLEDPKSTIEGARRLIEMGVIPSIIPYRKVDGIRAPAIEINPLEYYLVASEVGRMIKTAGLKPEKQTGCVGCTGCSVEADLSK